MTTESGRLLPFIVDRDVAVAEKDGSRVPWLVLGAGILIVASALVHLGRDALFYGDEWTFIQERRGALWGDLWRPHNGHTAAVPVVTSRIMWALFGLESYRPYLVLIAALHGLCVALVFVYARRRIGAVGAVTAASLLLVLGRANEDLLWAFQQAWLISVAAGLAALLLVDRRSVRADVLASTALVVAVFSSGIGTPFVAAAGVRLLVAGEWRRLWLVLVPLLAYGGWYLATGYESLQATPHRPDLGNLSRAPRYMARGLAAAAAAVFGVGGRAKWLVVVAIAAFAIAAVARRRVISPGFFGAAVGGLTFMGLTALTRAQFNDPDASRYVYPVAVFVLLGLIELAPRMTSRAWIAGGAALVAASAIGNLGPLRDGVDFYGGAGRTLAAQLTAAEVARDVADPTIVVGFTPPHPLVPPIELGLLYELLDDFGSPSMSREEILRADEQARFGFDAMSIGVLRLQLDTGVGEQDAEGPSGPACARFDPTANSHLDVRIPPEGLVLMAPDAPVQLQIRRVADQFNPPFEQIGPGRSGLFLVPEDEFDQPFTLRISGPGAASACPLQARSIP